MAMRREVLEFLDTFKVCWSMLGRYRIKDRKKNRQALIDLPLSAPQRFEVLMGLEPDDYVAGPKPDHTDSTKEVWEFGKRVQGTEVYIKLQVVQDRRKENVHYAVVWSFHPAEFPLRYPLRGGGP